MSQFGGIAVATAPTGGATPAGKSRFGGIAVNDDQPVAPDAPTSPSYGEELLNDFVSEPKGAWDQLKSDFVEAGGGTPEERQKLANAPFWDGMKTQFEHTLAAGKLPADAFNLVVSPISGLVRAGIANPLAHGMRAATHVVLPGSEQMEEQGKLPNQQQTEDTVMQDLIFPEKGGEVSAPKPRSTFSHFMQRPLTDPETFSKRYLHRKLTSEGIDKAAAQEQMRKPGSALVDLGSSAMTEAGEQAAMAGEGRRLGVNLFREDRMKGRRARAAEVVNKLGNDKNMYEHLDEQDEARRKNARPLYDEAFSPATSTAPFATELNKHYTKLAAEHDQAAADLERLSSVDHGAEPDAALATAKSNAEQADKRLNFAQGVSWDREGLKVSDKAWQERDAARKAVSDAEARKAAVDQKHATDIADAQKRVEEAKAKRIETLSRLHQAQSDEANGVKGAIWSPRVQEFIDDPLFKPGLRHGLEIQRTEALRDGVPFKPSDYGVTGTDANGDPIVGKVPNLRLLDAAKRGVDAILREKYTNKLTKEFEPDELGRAQVGANQEFVKELDRLTGGENSPYKKARKAWSDPTQIMDAVRDGMKFGKLAPELLKKKMAGMSEEVAEGYRTGVLRKISDEIAGGTRDALRVATNIVDDDLYQRQLKEILGDEKFSDLLDMAKREVDYAQRGGAVIGGSQTQRLKEGSKEIETLGSALADELVTSAGEGLTGFAASPKRLGMRLASRWMDHILTGMSQSRRDALAKLIFSTDEDDKMRALEMIYEEGQVSLPGHAQLPKATKAGLAAAVSPSQGQPQQ